MLQLRRTLAFSYRVHTYMLLLYVYVNLLFFAQLWWDTNQLYSSFVSSAHFYISLVGIVYGLLLVIISILIALFDRMIDMPQLVLTVLKTTLFLAMHTVHSAFETLVEHGIRVTL
ncbi:MAG: hypothetical protein ACOX0W_07320 [Sphaerochaetaceae bacterium]|jgi:hypothetical protein